MELTVKYALFLVLMTCLVGCNATIGMSSDPEAEPWRSLFLLSFFVLIITPAISTVLLIISAWKKQSFTIKLQKWLMVLLAVMVVFWLLGEISLTPRTNIRLDLFLTLPALAIQIFIVIIGKFLVKKRGRVHNSLT
jgi:heme A synthase